MNPLNIVAIGIDTTAVAAYRIYIPYYALMSLGGHSVKVAQGISGRTQEILASTIPDVVVVQRPHQVTMPSLIDFLHQRGSAVAVEIDDLMWQIPRWSPAYK